MVQMQRIKKTGTRVFVVGKEGPNHTMVIVPQETQTRKGNWGCSLIVRNDNLMDDNDP